MVLLVGLLFRSRISSIIPPIPPSSAERNVGLAVVALLGMIFVLLPTVLVRPNTELDREKLLKARNDVPKAGIQIVGGTALLAGLVFTNRTLGLNQQGQITDRFTKATDQLGSDKLAIRLGGIYSLERIARDSKADHGPVMEVLTAFVRDHAAGSPTATPSPVGSSITATAKPRTPTDVQAVLTVVERRNISNDPKGYTLDLSHSDLPGAEFPTDALLSWANLSGANLSGADLVGAKLTGAGLSGANLSGADLLEADLSYASLTGANLSGAYLPGAQLPDAELSNALLLGVTLSGADLFGATLSNANLSNALLFGSKLSDALLSGANLSGANLSGTDLSGANLSKADLSGAGLPKADLSGANLSGAHFSRADLSGANLSGAHLSGADLSGAAGLSQDQVDSAFTDEATKLPPERHPSTLKP
jgi:uncharacterized protein YjbI with pentapeptide repeats